MLVNKDFEKRLNLKNRFDGSLVLGGRDFEEKTGRSDFLRKKQGLGIIEDYIDKKTKLVKDKYLKERSCLVCGSKSERFLFAKYGFKHVRCKECGFIFVNPILKEEFSRKHYEFEKDWVGVLLNKTQQDFDIQKFKFGLEIIESYFDNRGNLLDIGCGTGLFIKMAALLGWNVFGIEFNTSLVNSLKEEGYYIYDEPLDKLNLQSESFECITLWEVVEHLSDPQALLKQVKRVLKPDGILFILVPNVNSLSVRILKERHNTFAPHSHINFFSPSTLSMLLNKSNFCVEEVETIISEIGVIKEYLDGYENQGDKEDKFSFITPEIIHHNLLGSKLIVVSKNDP